MRCIGENYPGTDFTAQGNKEHALAHLWNAIEGCIEQSIATDVALFFKYLANFFCYVLTTMIQHIWNIFD